jgi:hypothetical protein
MFIGKWLRSAPKPECISAQTLRARTRMRVSAGQRRRSGNFSARYSAMASVSHTAKPPSTSTATRPAGVWRASSVLNVESGVKASKRIFTSSNAMPACVISTHGRIDQDE